MFGIDDALIAAVAPSVISAGTSLFSKQPKTRRPTELINLYSRLSKEGKYSPAAMSSIIGRAGSEAGNAEQQAVADMRGQFAANGMGRSVAGTRALALPGMQRMRTLADLGGNLTAENEASKIDARQSLAEILGNYSQARDDERTARRNQIVGGIGDAVGAGIAGFAGQKELAATGDFNKLHTGIRSYILGGGDTNSDEFAAMFEQVYGMKWPGAKRVVPTVNQSLGAYLGEDYR